MSDSNASQDLDGDVLGEEVGDDGMPGVGDYPADQALGVNDPNLVADDDVAMREARTEAEAVPTAEDRPGDLLPPEDGVEDHEEQAVALEGEADHGDRADVPAEVAALHVEPEA